MVINDQLDFNLLAGCRSPGAGQMTTLTGLILLTFLAWPAQGAPAAGAENKSASVPAAAANSDAAKAADASAPNTAPGAAAASTGAAVPAPAADALFAGFMDAFEYDPRGRKDPFVQPIPEKPLPPGAPHGPLLPLQAYNLDQLRLVGIIWDVRHPKAMIKDPDGKTHIVGPNTKVGPKNGYIAVIREGEMVVVETTEQMGKLVSTAQVVKIGK